MVAQSEKDGEKEVEEVTLIRYRDDYGSGGSSTECVWADICANWC